MEKKKLPEIVLRTITGTMYFAIIVLLLVFDDRYFATAFAGIASLFAVWEYFSCVELKKSPFMIYGILLSILTTVSVCIFQEKVFEFFSLILVFVFAITIIIGILASKKYSFKDIVVAVFGYLYTIFLVMFIARIFFFTQGNIKVALLLTIVIATDTFAFLIGRKFGKHKFTKISPNKSIEGSIAGIIAAIIFSMVYTVVVNKYFSFDLNYFIMIAVATVLSILSQIGDLAASYIKREYNKKDFGNVLAGQGGVLDRIDSLIFTAPFAYLIISWLM